MQSLIGLSKSSTARRLGMAICAVLASLWIAVGAASADEELERDAANQELMHAQQQVRLAPLAGEELQRQARLHDQEQARQARRHGKELQRRSRQHFENQNREAPEASEAFE
jgi:hypothetical protein